MAAGSVAFGFAAGVLSTLSPCVLPLLPLVLGPALAQHRFGVLALTAGLVTSFVAIGMFVATIGFGAGLDGEWFRTASALLLAVMGVVLLSKTLQDRFAASAGGVSDGANKLIQRITPTGLGGQFLLGLLLGGVWSPCVGPTLGAASVLAAQGQDLGAVALVMAAFGAGTAVPLLVVGAVSRGAMKRWRGAMMGAGQGGRRILGGGAIAVALLILTGLDRPLESALVAASPSWLTRLTTQF